MLKNVVLPAPFGPMRLTVESRGMVKSTLSTATRPPNSLRSLCVTRMSLIGRPLPTEREKGLRGNVRETWFPSRERAEGERRSCRFVLERRVVHPGLELELAPPLGEEPLRPQQHHEHNDRAVDPERHERCVEAAAADDGRRVLLVRIAHEHVVVHPAVEVRDALEIEVLEERGAGDN